MRAAEEMGAAKVPEAALELKLAHDQTEQAKQLLKNGEKDRADLLLLRAQADAELALALAKEGPLVADAKNASDEVKALQQVAFDQLSVTKKLETRPSRSSRSEAPARCSP